MKTGRVIYHRETDGWWAESPDVPGWSAAASGFAELVELAREGIPFALSCRRPAPEGQDGAQKMAP